MIPPRNGMKHIAKNLIERLPPPTPTLILDTLRWLRYPLVRRQRRQHQRVYARIGRPRQVLQGPFRGMQYLSRAYFGSVLPKLLGTYELELREVIESICQLGADRIVDVGAAEGYYAVGLAVRSPGSTIVGFELDATGR